MIRTQKGRAVTTSRGHPGSIFILTILLCLIFGGFYFLQAASAEQGPRIKKEKKALKKIRESIKSEKAKLSKLNREERSLHLTLETVNTQMELYKNELILYRSRLKTARQDERRIKKSLDKIKKDIKKNQKLLSETLRRVYKKGRFSYIKLMFSAETFSDFLLKTRYAERLSALESEVIQKLKFQKSTIKVSRNTLRVKKESIKVFIRNISLKQSSSKDAARKKRELISSIKARKDVFKKHIGEFKKAQKKLRGFIDRLERRRKKNMAVKKGRKERFSKKRGKLSWPARGKVISSFGKFYDKKFNARSFNNGIEIRVKKGSGVKAVLGGVIIFSDWFRGYGKLIVLDNDGGFYTLYGHLEKLLRKTGEKISAGETVGLAGDTDSINGNALYFGIRSGGTPLNPLKWLR